MKNKKTTTKNYLSNIILILSSSIFPFITFPYVSRVLTPVGTGKVAFATSVVGYFLLFSRLGIPTYGIKVCAQARDDKNELTRIVHELLFINFVCIIICYLALITLVVTVPALRQEEGLYFILGSSIFLSMIGMEWLYQGLEEYRYITVRSIIFKLIALIALFIFVKKESDYVAYGAITVLASSASYIMNFIYARKYINYKPIGNYNLKRHFKPILMFFLMSCAATVYTHLDTVMLGAICNDRVVGIYNASVKIKGFLLAFVISLSSVLLPRVSYYIKKGMYDEFKYATKYSLLYVLAISLPFTVFFTYMSYETVMVLSGKDYVDSVVAMQCIMPTLVFIGLSNVIGIQTLIPLGQERIVLYSEIVGAVVDFSLNMLLIPRLQATGAAIGTTMAELTVLLYQVVRVKMLRVIDQINIIKNIIIYALASLLSLIPAIMINKIINGAYLLMLLVSALFYFTSYLIILILLREDFAVAILNKFIQLSGYFKRH